MDSNEITTKEEAAPLFFEKILAGSAEEVKILLKGFPGIANEFTDNQGNTALHLAAAEGDKAMAEILIKHGARLDVENNQGFTPIDAAQQNQRTPVGAAMGYANTDPVLDYLIEQKQKLNQPDKDDLADFINSVKEGYTEAALKSLKKFPGIANKAKDKEGNSALHLAAAKGDKAMAEVLVEEGYANIYAKNQKGKTPTEFAKENQRTYVGMTMGYSNTGPVQKYLEQVNSDLDILHKSPGSKDNKSPWLAELRNKDGKKLSDLVQERKKADEEKKANTQERKRAKMPARKKDKAAEQKNSQEEDFGIADLFNTEKEEDSQESKPKPAEAEKQRIDNVKEKVSNAIQDTKIKKLLEEQIDYYTSANLKDKTTTKMSKIDFLAEGISTLKKLKEMEKKLDLDKISKISELEKIEDQDQKIQKLKVIESKFSESKDKITNSIKQIEKDVSTKELAKLVAPKRTSAIVAKALTFGYRKTDNDLAKEAIDQLRAVINHPNSDAEKATPIKRWNKNNSKGK
ncbi:MAG: ankyrin repeat domain-containing protein [Rickettsiales bacterium]